MSLDTWRKEALEHSKWLLQTAGKDYALQAADEAEKRSEGVLKGLGAKLRDVVRAELAKGK